MAVVGAMGAEEGGCVWAGIVGMMACEVQMGAVAAHFAGGGGDGGEELGKFLLFLCKEGSYILYPAHIMLLIKSLTVRTVPDS